MPKYAKQIIAKLVGIDQVTKHHDPLSLPATCVPLAGGAGWKSLSSAATPKVKLLAHDSLHDMNWGSGQKVNKSKSQKVKN